MLIRIPGVNTTTKKNKRAGRVKRYCYHRETGERLPDDPTSALLQNSGRIPLVG